MTPYRKDQSLRCPSLGRAYFDAALFDSVQRSRGSLADRVKLLIVFLCAGVHWNLMVDCFAIFESRVSGETLDIAWIVFEFRGPAVLEGDGHSEILLCCNEHIITGEVVRLNVRVHLGIVPR